MKITASKRIKTIEPEGVILTIFNLPPANTKRWVASRKAEVVAAVHRGVLSMVEACHRYRLSVEEFQEWDRHYRTDGETSSRSSARAPLPARPLH